MFVDSLVYTVSARDADVSTPNNQVHYSLQSVNPGLPGVWELQGAGLHLVAPLDADGDVTQYFVIVRAMDRGSPSLWTEQTITIRVTSSLFTNSFLLRGIGHWTRPVRCHAVSFTLMQCTLCFDKAMLFCKSTLCDQELSYPHRLCTCTCITVS